MEKIYKCECGREFKNSQSLNAHKSHCRTHLGEDRYNKRLESQRKFAKIGYDAFMKKCDERHKKLNDEWYKSDHYCEKCGKQIFKKIGNGRFCSNECCKGYSRSNKINEQSLTENDFEINSGSVKKYLFENGLKEYKCEICGITEWNNKQITLQLHHIDGNNMNNYLSNLQILCPNCHSQTDSFCVIKYNK